MLAALRMMPCLHSLHHCTANECRHNVLYLKARPRAQASARAAGEGGGCCLPLCFLRIAKERGGKDKHLSAMGACSKPPCVGAAWSCHQAAALHGRRCAGSQSAHQQPRALTPLLAPSLGGRHIQRQRQAAAPAGAHCQRPCCLLLLLRIPSSLCMAAEAATAAHCRPATAAATPSAQRREQPATRCIWRCQQAGSWQRLASCCCGSSSAAEV